MNLFLWDLKMMNGKINEEEKTEHGKLLGCVVEFDSLTRVVSLTILLDFWGKLNKYEGRKEGE